MREEEKQKLQKILNESNHIVFFGGAGVSTESGIPDFRSKNGLYNQKDVKFDAYTPEYLLSLECLAYHPDVFFEFYRQKLDTRNIKPNITHEVLAKMENVRKLDAIVTQNIDGLHQKAGSKNVFEIHGTTKQNYCMDCGKEYDENYIFDCNEDIPKCECGGIVRPNVTLYGEQLPKKEVDGAIHVIKNADCLIIGGTSLTVYPAANFIRYFTGKHLIVINKTPLDMKLDKTDDLIILDSLGNVFSEIEKMI